MSVRHFPTQRCYQDSNWPDQLPASEGAKIPWGIDADEQSVRHCNGQGAGREAGLQVAALVSGGKLAARWSLRLARRLVVLAAETTLPQAWGLTQATGKRQPP